MTAPRGVCPECEMTWALALNRDAPDGFVVRRHRHGADLCAGSGAVPAATVDLGPAEIYALTRAAEVLSFLPDRYGSDLDDMAFRLWGIARGEPRQTIPASAKRGKGSPAFKERFARELDKVLADRGLDRVDVLDRVEMADLFGMSSGTTGAGWPAAAFTLHTKRFWLRSDVDVSLQLAAEKRRAVSERVTARAAARERRLTGVSARPPGQSGFRRVMLHRRAGLWYARGYGGSYRSLGYFREVEDAARAVDYDQLSNGRPAVNFPDSTDVTLAAADRWMTRKGRGPRGVLRAVEAAVDDGASTIDEVLARLDGLGTTRKTVAVDLNRLARDGRIVRVSVGVYGPQGTPSIPGVMQAALDALDCRGMTVADVFAKVAHLGTTRHAVSTYLALYVKAGDAVRVRRGVYARTPLPGVADH